MSSQQTRPWPRCGAGVDGWWPVTAASWHASAPGDFAHAAVRLRTCTYSLTTLPTAHRLFLQRLVSTTPKAVNVMSQESCAVATLVVIAFAVALQYTHAQPPTADGLIAKDRIFRLSAGKGVAKPPQLGFFGTIFHLILEQINDTKSAYNQISDLVGNQFTDDNEVTPGPDPANNGTTESPKISRQEFLKILDRNLKGLQRLRALEWREARKDSWANLGGYKDELFGGKKGRRKR